MKTITTVCSMAALLAVSPALAADLSLKDSTAPAGTALVEWSGLYVGAHIGYGWGNYDASYKADRSASSVSKCTDTDDALIGYGMTRSECVPTDSTNEFTSPLGGGDKGSYLLGSVSEIGTGEFDMDSMIWGGGLSYKIKRDRIIIEPFADASYGGGDFKKSWSGDVTTYLDHDGKEQPLAGVGNVTETGSISVDKRWDATLGLKGGVLFTGRDYVYALGGLSYGKFNVKGGSVIASDKVGLEDATIATSYNDDENAWGYTVGGGWEHAVTSNVHFGVEGRYTAFSDIGASASASKTIDLAPVGPLNLAGSESVNGDYDEWSVRARISYRFGN